MNMYGKTVTMDRSDIPSCLIELIVSHSLTDEAKTSSDQA
jgi:hypothetical protein